MRRRVSKKRLSEIQATYEKLGLGSEEDRQSFQSFLPPADDRGKAEAVFIETGTTSLGPGELDNARLESTAE